jgi:hypothetical protein
MGTMDIALPTHLQHVPWALGIAALIGFALATLWYVRSFRRAPIEPPLVPGSRSDGADEGTVGRDPRG